MGSDAATGRNGASVSVHDFLAVQTGDQHWLGVLIFSHDAVRGASG
jgi:hypothetical protein